VKLPTLRRPNVTATATRPDHRADHHTPRTRIRRRVRRCHRGGPASPRSGAALI